MNKTLFKGLRRLRPSNEAMELLLEIGTIAVSFLLSTVRFFFDTYPFALAFCAANKKRAPFAMVGCALGTVIFLEDRITYLIALLALIGLRLVGSIWLGDDGGRDLSLGRRERPSFLSSLFMEKTSVRVGISTLCALGIGVSRVIINSYAYYDIFVLIFHTVLCSILTYALCTLFEEEDRSRLFGYCALIFALIFAIRAREIFGLDVSIVLSYALTLYASKYISGAGSTALGALLGICHGVAFAPVFAICGLVSSFLWGFSYYLAIISALVMSVGYGVFASGYEALVYLLPELLLASLVMYPLTRFEIIPRLRILGTKKSEVTDALVLNARTSALRESLLGVSSSFARVSEMISDLSRRAKNPDRDFWRSACLEVCEKHCYQCPKRSICWEKDSVTTKDNLTRMGEMAFCERVLSFDFVDEKFLHRCPNIEKIVDEINVLKRELSRAKQRYDKLEVSAQDYELVSKLISGLCDTIEGSTRIDAALSDKATRACKKLGVRCDGVEVLGDRVKRVVATNIDTESTKCTLDEIHAALEESLDTPLTEMTLEETEAGKILRAQGMRRFDIESKREVIPVSADEEAGDTLCSFFSSDDKYYMLLCDGMGSGADAHMTSSICAEFMQRILASVSDKELCLSMLNNFLRAKSLECSSSVDLLEVDLISGAACLIKSGAAPSFVKRGENIFRLHSKTAPIGIMRSPDAERLDFNLRDGDILVMVSDGVASDEKDSKYLVDFLSRVSIVEGDEEGEIIDTSPDKSITRESLSPANQVVRPVPAASVFSLLSESNTCSGAVLTDTAPTVITLSALPSAIAELAKSRTSAAKDDISVGVIKISHS